VLTALEIKKQEFSKSMRGYDTAEVRGFLDTVAADVEKLSASVQAQSSEIERLKAESEAYRRLEGNMKDALINSQETLKDARESARKEAELTKREAEFEADKIIQSARKQEGDILRELSSLAERRDRLVVKLKTILRSELELIDLLEKEEKKSNESTFTTKQSD